MATYVVSGASRGIGEALIGRIIELGNKAIAIIRNEEDAFRISSKYNTEDLMILPIDLRDPNLESEICSSIEEFGGVVDVLINNAGTGGSGKSLIQTDLKLVSSLFENNCLTALALSKYCMPYLLKSDYPQVVNVISRFGLIDVLQKTDMTVSYAYSLSKGALHQLTVLMNRDSSLKDVSIYSVDPGPTKTRMGREDAVASPAEVAIKFLELIQRQDPKLGGSYFKIEV